MLIQTHAMLFFMIQIITYKFVLFIVSGYTPLPSVMCP